MSMGSSKDVAAFILLTLTVLACGCGRSGKNKILRHDKPIKMGDATVQIYKISLLQSSKEDADQEHQRRQPILLHNRPGEKSIRIEFRVEKAHKGKDFRYYGWLDPKARTDHKNFATLTNAEGEKFKLITTEATGGYKDLEFDGGRTVSSQNRYLKDYLVFALPETTEGELLLNLSGRGCDFEGDYRVRIPVEDWSHPILDPRSF